jgi:hypothetical protein
LYLVREVYSEIFVNYAVAGGKEGKDVLQEVSLGIFEIGPVSLVLFQVDFLCGPKARGLFFVGLPDVLVLNGE